MILEPPYKLIKFDIFDISKQKCSLTKEVRWVLTKSKKIAKLKKQPKEKLRRKKEDKVTPSSEAMDWKWLDPIEGLKLDLTKTVCQALEDFLKAAQ